MNTLKEQKFFEWWTAAGKGAEFTNDYDAFRKCFMAGTELLNDAIGEATDRLIEALKQRDAWKKAALATGKSQGMLIDCAQDLERE